MPRPVAERLRSIWNQLARTARLAIGLPDYQTYLRHRAQAHPGEPVMSYEAFFRSRQDARYRRGATRCC